MKKRTTLGWRAERRKRGLIRLGRLRAGTLAYDKTGELSADRTMWITDFRAVYPCRTLSDDDIALSLAWDARHAPPGTGWPQDGLVLSNAAIAVLISSDPEDVQAMQMVLDDAAEYPAEVVELAGSVVSAYKANPAAWSVTEEIMELIHEFGRDGSTATLRGEARRLTLPFIEGMEAKSLDKNESWHLDCSGGAA